MTLFLMKMMSLVTQMVNNVKNYVNTYTVGMNYGLKFLKAIFINRWIA